MAVEFRRRFSDYLIISPTFLFDTMGQRRKLWPDMPVIFTVIIIIIKRDAGSLFLVGEV